MLTTLFLLQFGYDFVQYVSFENHIENHKKVYYDALMTTQRKRGTSEETLDKWLVFFLESLKTLTEKLEQKYSVFKQKGGYLNERQKKIKDYINVNQPVKIADLSAAFPKISLNTLKKDLKYLRDEQVLTMIGERKNSVYILNKRDLDNALKKTE